VSAAGRTAVRHGGPVAGEAVVAKPEAAPAVLAAPAGPAPPRMGRKTSGGREAGSGGVARGVRGSELAR
jgi:hypothetical protein